MTEDNDGLGSPVEAGGSAGGARFAPMSAELDLDADDRLPWLDSDDDDYDEGEIDTGRVLLFALVAIALLAALVGGIWWFTHKRSDSSQIADGGIIPAPTQPYKEAPRDPGGKTFAGTGDTSYAVSQGKDAQSHLTGAAVLPAASPSASASPIAAAVPSSKPAVAKDGARPAPATTGGVAVQVGAYGSQAGAEAAWSRLAGKTDALKGVSHRVVEGNADIGKVYRLQAVVGDEAAGNALCGRLKTAGIACQVKR